MATTIDQINTTDGWVQIATAVQNFSVELEANGYDMMIVISDSTPDGTTYGHRVTFDTPFTRNGAQGKAFIKTDAPEDIRYIFTTGAII